MGCQNSREINGKLCFLLGDCQAKMHSTFTEAVRISQRMEAKQTIFTHFSQRYAKVPVLEEFEVKEAKNCAIGMKINVMNILQFVCRFYPKF